MDKKFLFEGVIDSKDGADFFVNKKIDRLEVNRELDKDGLTPSFELVDYCLNTLKVDSVIMLRERNDFVFTESDYLRFKEVVPRFIELGARKFIFGFIKNGDLDVDAMKKVIALLKGCEFSFHMGIDHVENYHDSIEKLIDLGFSWILTKGGTQKPALENLEKLKTAINLYGSKINFLVGGKVTKDNWQEINSVTGANWFHGKLII